MIIAIMQPTYLPWLGYFELMDNCDLFVFLDDAQFVKKSWHHRNRIKTPMGEILLTVPVLSKGKRGQQIMDVITNNELPWRKKHFRSILNYYNNARFAHKYIPKLEMIYMKENRYLLGLNVALIEFLKDSFGISTKTIMSSTLKASGSRSEKVVNICKQIGSDILYDAQGAKDILDHDYFKKNNIKLIFQEYNHPTYEQLHGDFISHLSALDLLLNEGDRALDIIRSGRSH